MMTATHDAEVGPQLVGHRCTTVWCSHCAFQAYTARHRGRLSLTVRGSKPCSLRCVKGMQQRTHVRTCVLVFLQDTLAGSQAPSLCTDSIQPISTPHPAARNGWHGRPKYFQGISIHWLARCVADLERRTAQRATMSAIRGEMSAVA